MAFAQIGAIDAGGVNRQALTGEDGLSQRYLVELAHARGFACSRDHIGNLFIQRDGLEADAKPILMGSHLDSQPTGGRFDGAYGVLAGFELLETLEDMGLSTVHPIAVVAWMNEEGCRFQPGAMGSGVFAGSYDLSAMLDRKDRDGVTVGEALNAIVKSVPLPVATIDRTTPAGYIEVHIEQGPVLEGLSLPVGVVTGIQGIRRLLIEIRGREAHAGTTPRAMRRDALSAAVGAISKMEVAIAAADAEDLLRFTVGMLTVSPNSTNTIPGTVRFTIDLRHRSDQSLKEAAALIEGLAKAAAAAGRCELNIETISNVSPTQFDSELVAQLESVAVALQLGHTTMTSGAGHDAMHIAKCCPTAMVFVPCANGVSHHPSESANADDLIAGARVMAAVILRNAGLVEKIT